MGLNAKKNTSGSLGIWGFWDLRFREFRDLGFRVQGGSRSCGMIRAGHNSVLIASASGSQVL